VASGRVDEARRHWEKAFRAEPRLVIFERLLDHSEGARERSRLIATLQKQRLPLAPGALHLLAARVALEGGDPEAAAAELQAIPEQEAPVVQRYWAEVYKRRGETRQAVDALSRAADAGGLQLNGYRCSSCGRASAAWSGHCQACDSWGTVKPSIEQTLQG
jgi:lipopolysaccharide biosynthesis regulator YciM